MTAQSKNLCLYDTFSREVKPVVPADKKTLRFYACGPTVYGSAHIGNFRTFILQDVFRRTVEAGGTATFHVRNITNVDDKTIRQSQAEGRTLEEFTGYWKDRFQEDCKALNLLPPHVEPGAVEHIEEQISLITKLIETGHAYEKGGSVYFKVDSFEKYGRLSRLEQREITTSSALADSDEYERDSASDFALWKARKPEDGENFWPCPWGEGKGRPGWHIECSAMAMKYLGETMDLHSGGIDLCFPHHENEIAQSEASTGKTFAQHWFHITHLLVEGKKMSKSLGNLYTLEDIRNKGFLPAELRYVLFSAHYRQPLNFTWDSLKAAQSALEKIRRFDKRLRSQFFNEPEWHPGKNDNQQDNGAFEPAWLAILDDLNTPKALGELFSALNKLEKAEAAATAADFRGWQRMIHALGLNLEVEEKDGEGDVPENVRQLAQKRWDAKKAKDFALADQLRQEITSLGWSVKDAKDGFEVEPL